MKIFKELPLWNKVAIINSVGAVIFCILNLIFRTEELRALLYIFLIICFLANQLAILERSEKYRKCYLFEFKKYDDLLWSYCEMGRYIDGFNIPELADLQQRIEMELLDVEAKQELYATQIGVSDLEFKRLKEEGLI